MQSESPSFHDLSEPVAMKASTVEPLDAHDPPAVFLYEVVLLEITQYALAWMQLPVVHRLHLVSKDKRERQTSDAGVCALDLHMKKLEKAIDAHLISVMKVGGTFCIATCLRC